MFTMVEADDQESEAISLATPSSRKRKRTAPFASGEPSVAAAEILPESVCRMCLNLGNEVWDLGYCERHSLGMVHGARRMPLEDVAIAAKQGCPGCEIIAWALKPYVKQLQNSGQVFVSFDHIGEATSRRLSYRNRLPSPATSHTWITIKKSPPQSVRDTFLWTNSKCGFKAVSESIPQPC